MDQRARGGCLLAIAVEREAGGYRVTMWTFPRDQALRFSTDGGAPTVDVLQDAFSQNSNLRKAAMLLGADGGPTSFLTARVVDLQSGSQGEAADYWMRDFLNAELSLGAEAGSRALGRALRAAADGTSDDGQREQLYNASIALRASTTARWSMLSFANQFLTGPAKARFMRTKEFRQHRAEQFRFNAAAFDQVLQFRVLNLDNGVRISAPFAQAEDLLEISRTTDGTRVIARGTVREDKISQRP